MKKVLVIALAFALTFVLGYASPVPAQELLKLSGAHYTLNIIGVAKDKNHPTMTDSERHTIFVGLGSKGTATTKIYLQPGYDFRVCDGNGFDPAYGCDGSPDPIKPLGATFQLPCNTYLTYDPDLGCPADIAQRSYRVFVRALGKPGGEAKMWTCATETTTGDLVCTMPDNVIELPRSKGRSRWTEVTDVLTSIYADGVTIALFADGYQDFFWQYDNNGLKLAQIRLYPVRQ